MPAVVKKNGPSSKPWCVYSHEGGKRLGCHETEEKAKKQQAAVNMNVSRELTFSDMEGLIRLQWGALFDPEDYDHPYLRYIFPEYAVFTHDGKFYRVEYDMDGTEVEFDLEDVSEVEMGFNPVRSGAVLTPRPIRAVDQDDGVYTGYAVLFGAPEDKDVYGTYFDANTRYYLDWWDTRPWLYTHGMDMQTPLTRDIVRSGAQRVGTWNECGIDDVGVYVKGELDKRNKYIEYVKHLLEVEEILFPSSGTIDYLMKVGPDGHVEDWPIAEVSSTVAPAELRMRPISDAGRAALRALSGTEGGFTMALPERLKEMLQPSKSVEEAEVETETEEVEDAAEDEDAEVEEQETDVEETATNASELAEAVARHMNLDAVVQAIQTVDGAVEELSSRMDVFEAFAKEVAKDEPERVKSFVQNPDWHTKLFSASRSGEEVDEEAAEEIKGDNDPPADDEGGVYGATKIR